MKENFFITRHSLKPAKGEEESAVKPGISEKGVELARVRALELKELIDKTPEDSIVFIGGATEAERTASTAEVYGEELYKLYENDKTTRVLTKEKIKEISHQAGSPSKAMDVLIGLINEHKNQRFILSFPMMIKELSLGKRWGFWDKQGPRYFRYLNKKNGNNEEAAFKEWIGTGGKTDQEGIEGPNPEEVAKEYIGGLRRLRGFVKKYIGDRPIIIGAVTHRFDLDAAAVKLLKGIVDQQTTDEVLNGSLSKETELLSFEIDDKGDIANVKFRNYEK